MHTVDLKVNEFLQLIETGMVSISRSHAIGVSTGNVAKVELVDDHQRIAMPVNVRVEHVQWRSLDNAKPDAVDVYTLSVCRREVLD